MRGAAEGKKLAKIQKSPKNQLKTKNFKKNEGLRRFEGGVAIKIFSISATVSELSLMLNSELILKCYQCIN